VNGAEENSSPGGPRRAQDLWRAARQLGLARTTVLRAKKKLSIRHTRALTQAGWTGYWLFAGQQIPDHPPAPSNLEPWLKPIREKYGKRMEED
jgi:hypothetical protein